MSEVIGLLEGTMAPVDCVNDPNFCNRSELCATRHLWDDVKQAIDGVLSTTTLQDLADRQRAQEQSKKEMTYSI